MKRRELLYRTALASAGFAARQFAGGQTLTIAPGLVDVAGRAHIQTGCSLDLTNLQRHPELRQAMQQDVSVITPESAMKWPAVEPERGRYDFAGADAYFAFAAANRMKVRGHNLCWCDDALPLWFRSALTKADAASVLTRHIQAVVGRYSGNVHSWDVVNEAVRLSDRQTDGLAAHPWRDILGPEYIDLAFHTARSLDAISPLVLNEVAMEADDPYATSSRAALLKLLRGMRSRGVPVDVLGLESHIRTETPLGGKDFIDFIKAVKDLGLRVYITELDVDDTHFAGSTSQREMAVAAKYQQYLDLMLPLADTQLVVFWSYLNGSNWLDWLGHQGGSSTRADGRNHRPGLRQENLQPTPALAAVRDALVRHSRSR